MDEYLTESGAHYVLGGIRKIYKFPNGYGASVIDCGYGDESNPWELAVIDHDLNIQYDTPIRNGVIGWLTDERLEETLDKIRDMDLSQIPFECKCDGIWCVC